jgi:nucleotide-binding universal stress UspA family protein
VPRYGTSEFSVIVVAIDGSRHSAAAAVNAINIAASTGASLTIVTVVPSDADNLENISYAGEHRDLIADQQMHMAEQNVRQVKELASERGVVATGLIYSGSPYEAILQIASERSANLIVLGSHGKTALEKVIIGSVAERVVMLSPCSTLVTPCPV